MLAQTMLLVSDPMELYAGGIAILAVSMCIINKRK